MISPKTTYRIELQALGDDSRPAVTRLRRLLKHALRALRLRCVTVREVHGDESSPVAVETES